LASGTLTLEELRTGSPTTRALLPAADSPPQTHPAVQEALGNVEELLGARILPRKAAVRSSGIPFASTTTANLTTGTTKIPRCIFWRPSVPTAKGGCDTQNRAQHYRSSCQPHRAARPIARILPRCKAWRRCNVREEL
jgi:hypothetical protein